MATSVLTHLFRFDGILMNAGGVGPAGSGER